jgi:hypothetical protein
MRCVGQLMKNGGHSFRCPAIAALVPSFFARLDDVFCPMNGSTPPEKCRGDFSHAKNTLQRCGFDESDWSDVFHVLMGQGAFCDCEILYNADIESRLKTQYWQSRAHETR